MAKEGKDKGRVVCFDGKCFTLEVDNGNKTIEFNYDPEKCDDPKVREAIELFIKAYENPEYEMKLNKPIKGADIKELTGKLKEAKERAEVA
jgi:hypothetical protein